MVKFKNALKFNKNIELLYITLPAVILIFIFAYLPMFGIIVAFKNYRFDLGIWGSKWVGFDNFKFLFSSQDAFRITRNTVLMNGAFIIADTVISVCFALLLNEISRKFIKIYQTIMFFPYFLSWVVVSYVFIALFDMDLGLINNVLKTMGFESILWYSESAYWPIILIITHLWKVVGYGTIIYYTALIGINSEYYEAAVIDGASKLQQIRHISIPLLVPMVTLLVIIKIGGIFRADFGMFFFLTKDTGALYPTTDVIDTYVFRSLRELGDIGMASAAGLYQSVVGFILVLLTNKTVKKINPENAIF